MTSIRLGGNFIRTMLFVLRLRWLQDRQTQNSETKEEPGESFVGGGALISPLNQTLMSKHVLQSEAFKFVI